MENKESIKILQVFGKLNRGGAETMLMNIYRKIDRNKFQFDFIIHTKEKCDYNDEIEKLGGKIYSIPRYKIYNHFQYKKAWKNFFAQHPEYKIIHSHVRSTASIYLKIAKKYGLKTVAHSHSTSSGKGIRAIIKNILQYRIRFAADCFLGCSQEANRWLFGKKIANSKKCMVLKNGIELNKFLFNTETREKIREKLGVKENEILIGHVGRFVKVKNHSFLIKVFKKYYNDVNNNTKLLLIGDGCLKEKVSKKVKKIGLEKQVIFKEKITNVQDYYNAMDIFVFPSLFEGLGIVLIEAQLSGLNCIISKNIPEEAIISKNVKRINEFNVNQWVNAIKFDIQKCNNREMLEKKGRKENYDINYTTKQIEKFYMKLNLRKKEE